MEPPGEGRYERGGGIEVLHRVEAAMEPPGEGRYEAASQVPVVTSVVPPQWSRPVKGGTSPPSRGRRPPGNCRNGAAR